jgi:5-methyltetrahydrofolate--homocysteine methyltransferase
MFPAASVSGLYFAHPQARYFTVGQLGADQIADYARRKGKPIDAVEGWLSANLSYEPRSMLRRSSVVTTPVSHRP